LENVILLIVSWPILHALLHNQPVVSGSSELKTYESLWFMSVEIYKQNCQLSKVESLEVTQRNLGQVVQSPTKLTQN